MKTRPSNNSKIIARPFYNLLKHAKYEKAIYEATAKMVRDGFRRLVRMLKIFGHGIFKDDIDGKSLSTVDTLSRFLSKTL